MNSDNKKWKKEVWFSRKHKKIKKTKTARNAPSHLTSTPTQDIMSEVHSKKEINRGNDTLILGTKLGSSILHPWDKN